MSDPEENRHTRLTQALRRVVLLRETGPKSAAWHRARTQTIWRLHHLIEAAEQEESRRDESSPGNVGCEHEAVLGAPHGFDKLSQRRGGGG